MNNTTNEATNWTIAPDFHNAACDYCGAKAIYDAQTKQGPWAFVCDAHFASETTGRLGLGHGQRLMPLGGQA